MKRFLWVSLILATLSSQVHAATLFSSDFNTASLSAWPSASAMSSSHSVSATVALQPVGTVDVADSTAPSGAMQLTARPPERGAWSAALVSGPLPVRTPETNLGKLTLSFSLSASAARPVIVRVESFNAAKRRTGGLSGLIYPAAPDFFQRYALDLSTLKPDGAGRFQPTAPFVQFSFGIAGGAGWPAGVKKQLRVDNVTYASPAYYVGPKGRDTNAGRTEATAFATPQKALDTAQPGDIVVLMDGTYNGGLNPVASFPRPGSPAAWIVLKNYPGQNPTLTSNGWNIINIAQGSKEKPYTGPALAYLEVRGLYIRGEGDVAKTKYPDAMDKSDSRTNSNGIAVDGRFTVNIFHDIRIADNLVEFAPGAGIASIDGDWVTVEGNTCRSNCWTTIYAPSGISVMGYPNFDAQDNVYKRLVRNNICCHNQTYEKWASLGRYSDGNGIILDVNQGPDPNSSAKAAVHAPVKYMGRTLVQSNLCYDNGGSGIHSFSANRVDIINNTAYMNSASVHLEYPQIFANHSDDVRLMNNILVAPVANTAAGENPEPVNGNHQCTNTVYAHNLYFGGNVAPVMGKGDVVGDPLFVYPSRDDKVADFHLKAGSPAIGRGMTMPFSPFRDLDGEPRKATDPAEGAYEK
jgi:hypothetical protein